MAGKRQRADNTSEVEVQVVAGPEFEGQPEQAEQAPAEQAEQAPAAKPAKSAKHYLQSTKRRMGHPYQDLTFYVDRPTRVYEVDDWIKAQLAAGVLIEAEV